MDRDWHKPEAKKMSWVDDVGTAPSDDQQNHDELIAEFTKGIKTQDYRVGKSVYSKNTCQSHICMHWIKLLLMRLLQILLRYSTT